MIKEFLASMNSERTRLAYSRALNMLEVYAESIRKAVLEMSQADADGFILSQYDMAPATVRKNAAAASSLFSFVERRNAGFRNPFRGTRARPKTAAARGNRLDKILAWKDDVDKILLLLPPSL